MAFSIKNNKEIMNEKCLCESCDNKKIIKHFEKCDKCGSTAYHSTPRILNDKKYKKKHEHRRNT